MYFPGIQNIDESLLHHVDLKNPHSFEMKDLEKLIQKVYLNDWLVKCVL
jgi:hypothetical protein